MSKVTGRQRYFAFQEWYNWAQHQYPILKKKKKAQPQNFNNEI